MTAVCHRCHEGVLDYGGRVAWFYSVLLSVGSAGILVVALTLTRRLFRDEAAATRAGDGR